MVKDRIPPFPKLLGLLVHHQIRLLLRHSAAGHHELSHPSNILFNFCS
jgi:hypothetical protein